MGVTGCENGCVDQRTRFVSWSNIALGLVPTL